MICPKSAEEAVKRKFAIGIEDCAILTSSFSATCEPEFAARFSDETSHAGNGSGNIHLCPPISAEYMDPLLKSIRDDYRCSWNCLGDPGVRIPLPPDC